MKAKEVLTLIFTLCVTVQSAAQDVTCDAAPADVSGTGKVTCHFSVDVTQRPLSLSVDLYPHGSERPVSLLECTWIAGNESCHRMGERYTFTPSPTKSTDMVLLISNLTTTDQGRYVCQQTSPHTPPVGSSACLLSLDDDPGQSTRPAVDEDSDPGLTPVSAGSGYTHVVGRGGQGADSTDSTTKPESETTTIIIAAAVAASAVLIIVIVVVFFVCRWRRRRRKDGGARDTDSETVDPAPPADTRQPPGLNTHLLHNDSAQQAGEEDADPEKSPEATDHESESDKLAGVSFKEELELTAAGMQGRVYRKMSTGEYP